MRFSGTPLSNKDPQASEKIIFSKTDESSSSKEEDPKSEEKEWYSKYFDPGQLNTPFNFLILLVASPMLYTIFKQIALQLQPKISLSEAFEHLRQGNIKEIRVRVLNDSHNYHPTAEFISMNGELLG